MTDKFATYMVENQYIPGYKAFRVWCPMYVWFNKKNLRTERDYYGVRKRLKKESFYRHIQQGREDNRQEVLAEWERMYSTEDELRDAFLSNFVNGDHHGGLWKLDSHEIYKNWKKRIQSMTYVFREDIETLVNDSNGTEFFFSKGGKNPLLLEYVNQKKVAWETLIILNQLSNNEIFDKYDEELDDPRWEKLKLLSMKYSVLLKINYDEYKKEMLDISKKLNT